MPKRRIFKKRNISRRVLVLGSIAALIVTAVIVLWVIFLAIETPSIENFKNRQVSESTKIYDRTGETLLWEVHGEERRTVVPFDKISRHLKNATIAIEDSSFYSHHGFSITSLFRIIFINPFIGKEIGSGGSTITQQLVKNTLLTNEHAISRKIKEIIIAIKLEAAYSKDDILNLYLNEIPYGSNAYGIEAASQTYFGKSSENLTLAEAAYLAALPKAPSYYSPYGNHRKDLDARKNIVLSRMQELGFISEEEYKKAKDENPTFLSQRKQGIRAPHFVMYIRELLNEKYGEDYVERSGLKVITTLDVKLQDAAEEIIAKRGPEIEKKYNASNMALVAIDPKTGRILSMVGSRDYFNLEKEGNYNVALAQRQPGSAFKPLVYATAFEKGYTPETVLFDLETNFAASGDPYIPHNYDDKFRGPVTMREALAQSLNVPAVKTLYLAGIQDSIETARNFGISTLVDQARYGLTLVLGGGEVTPLELTSAYGVFANEGVRADHHGIIEIRDHDNNIIEEENITSRQVIDPNITNEISSILSDNVARTPSFGAQSPLYFPNVSVAAKTGTTNDYRDVWTVGYSPNIVVGMWAGNNNNTSMTKNVAGFIIAPVWREFMDKALATVEPASFTPPKPSEAKKPVLRGNWRGSRSYFIDKASGKLATDFTPPDQREEHVTQEIHSILYWVDKNNPDGPIPTNPQSDPQFENWERPVRAWAASMNLGDNTSAPPTGDYDTSHDPKNWPSVTFDESHTSLSFPKDSTITLHPRITSSSSISEVDIFIDGEFTRAEYKIPQTISLSASSLNQDEVKHTVTLKAYDTIGNKGEGSIGFTLADL